MVDNNQKMLKERLRHVLSVKRLSIQKFVQLIATLDEEKRDLNLVSTRVMLGRQINGDALVTYETIRMFLFAFHDVDANYLVMGYGTMEKEESKMSHITNNRYYNEVATNGTQIGPINIGKDNTQNITNRDIEQRDIIIAQQTKRIAELERDNESLRTVLDIFKQRQ